MKKVDISIVLSLFLIFGSLSGCFENETEAISFNEVTLESDVVELVNGTIRYFKNALNEIWKVEVQYLFHNIANRDIEIEVTTELYDDNDNWIATLGPKVIQLPNDYTEKSVSQTVNIVSYDGDKVALVDHAIIVAVEYV